MATYRFTVDGKRVSVDAQPRDAAALRAARRSRPEQSAFRLRPRAVRRLHRASQRRTGALLRAAGVGGRRQDVTTLAGLGTPEKPHPLQAA